MKKSIKLLFFVLGIMILTGCAKVEDHVLIKADGKVLRDIVITVDKLDKSYSNLSASLANNEIYKQAEEQGYKATFEEQEDKLIYHLRKEIETADANNFTITYNNSKNDKKELFTITKKENLFKTEYVANSKFQISALKDLEKIDYSLYIHFPTNVKGDTNANKEIGKNVLVWQSENDKVKHKLNINFDVSSLKILNIICIIGSIIFVLLTIAYIIVRKKEQEIKEERRIPIKEKRSTY
ncbi:hypothetical protein [Viridibacillus arvi]|uniref:hypothetical protein n=1 Tax=Viridibacillus arvi TaxID=263475 RepID=UPI0034CE79EB